MHRYVTHYIVIDGRVLDASRQMVPENYKYLLLFAQRRRAILPVVYWNIKFHAYLLSKIPLLKYIVSVLS